MSKFINPFTDVGFAKKFRTDVALMDTETNQQFSDKLRMIFLQLPEFTKEADDCENYFERWIYVLKNMEILNRMPWAAQYAAFKRLAEICETAALTPQERSRYEESIKVYRDNLAIAERAEEEGMEKGLEKGRAEGIAEGKNAEKRQIASKMKSLGIETAVIIQATGLTAEEIDSL